MTRLNVSPSNICRDGFLFGVLLVAAKQHISCGFNWPWSSVRILPLAFLVITIIITDHLIIIFHFTLLYIKKTLFLFHLNRLGIYFLLPSPNIIVMLIFAMTKLVIDIAMAIINALRTNVCDRYVANTSVYVGDLFGWLFPLRWIFDWPPLVFNGSTI